MAVSALFLAGGACKKKGPASATGDLPDEVFAASSDADRVGSVTGQQPAPMSALADLYRLPTSKLPAWVDRCDLYSVPTPPDLPKAEALALACGPHGVLLFAAPEADGLTLGLARSAATEGMVNVLPGSARSESVSRPGRDGSTGVDILSVEGQSIALISAVKVDDMVVLATCSGPPHPHRATFCDAYVAGFVPGDGK